MVFAEPGVKVNGKYYWHGLLLQQMSAAIRYVVGDNFVFQQNSTPACAAVKLLRRETPDFISTELWPPTVRI